MLRMLQTKRYLASLTGAKSRNLTPKCKILNVFWTLPEVKVRIFSIGIQISKILILNDSEEKRNMIQKALK